MSDLLTPEVLLRYPGVVLAGLVIWWLMRHLRDERKGRAEGARECHKEMKRASEAMIAAAEATAGIKAVTEAQNQHLASLDATVQSLVVRIAQCEGNNGDSSG